MLTNAELTFSRAAYSLCCTVHNGGLSEGSAQCNMCPLSSLASREVAAVSQGEAESDYWGKLVYIYSWTGTGD